MKFFATFIVCLFTLTVFSQAKIEVQGKLPDLYFQHAVAAGESLQTVGAKYGVAPAKLASYNSLDPNAALPKNIKLRVPLTKDNFVQVKPENGLPVYHIVDKGDNLYRISIAYNKVGTAMLKEWNHMTADVVKSGQPVIVGFISGGHPVAEEKKDTKIKPAPSSTVIADLPIITPEKKKTDKPADKPIKTDPVVTAPPAQVEKPVATDTKPEARQETKKEAAYAPKDGDEGYFAVSYAEQHGDQLKQFRSGDAAVFKTTSGWTDRKYYILMNDANVGTVVRISGGGKNICAKVLGPLQEPKGNTNLLLRMSNAAAAALGINDAKFAVSVTYFE